jgi:hypothetical protein
MKYTAQRHRIAALEAALGRPGQVLRIIGGLPEAAPMLQPSEPVEPGPASPEPKPPYKAE